MQREYANALATSLGMCGPGRGRSCRRARSGVPVEMIEHPRTVDLQVTHIWELVIGSALSYRSDSAKVRRSSDRTAVPPVDDQCIYRKPSRRSCPNRRRSRLPSTVTGFCGSPKSEITFRLRRRALKASQVGCCPFLFPPLDRSLNLAVDSRPFFDVVGSHCPLLRCSSHDY